MENPKSRHFRALLNKYTIGLHSIRVVTQEGIMKVVNSIKAHGYLEDVNYPVVVFHSLYPRFKDRNAIRNSPALLEEIVTTGRLVYDAGAHRELAWQYFESHRDELPMGVQIPDAFMFEVLVNADNTYDFFILGKKHNKLHKHKTTKS